MDSRSHAQSSPSPPPHPGIVLLEHHLQPQGISQTEAAARLGLDPSEVSRFVHGHRNVDAWLAARLSSAFSRDAHYWLGLQNEHDLWQEQAQADRSNPRTPRDQNGPQTQASPPANAPPAMPGSTGPPRPHRPSRKTRKNNSKSGGAHEADGP